LGKVAIDNRKLAGIAERFLANEGRVLNTTGIAVHNTIIAERLDVWLQGDNLPDDRGMLYLYPIGDEQYCLQLCYLEYDESEDNRAIVYSVRFLPAFFDQYPAETLVANQPFRFDQTTEQQFSVCSQARVLLNQLEHEAPGSSVFIRSLQRAEVVTHLLRRALECITAPFTTCQVPACRFLAYESEREKITAAMAIIEQNIDQQHSIRELSRKVAMNECYLKKGFKALAGKTIHEYQQHLRISRAKVLLQEQGRSVTDVANILGYSSISHFSTAFKKVTGLKPCELLT
jgi:AraC-like DNA-binding protein